MDWNEDYKILKGFLKYQNGFWNEDYKILKEFLKYRNGFENFYSE